MSEQRGPLEKFAASVWAKVTAVSLGVSTLITIKSSIEGQPHWFWLVVLCILSIALCCYVIFKKINVGERFGQTKLVYLYPKWSRISCTIFVASFVAIPIMILILQRPKPQGFVILVADMEGPEGFGLTERLIETLRKGTAKYPEVSVKAAHKTISGKDGADEARALGTKEQAGVIVWGWYRNSASKTSVIIKCELLTKNHTIMMSPDNIVMRDVRSGWIDQVFPLVQLESFELQGELGTGLTSAALYFVAAREVSKNDWAGAIHILSEALTYSTSSELSADILLLRGYCRGQIGQNREDIRNQIDDFTQTILNNPNLSIPYDFRASCYFRFSLYEDALADCKKALQLTPGLPIYLAHEAQILCRLNRFDEAESAAQTACDEAPNFPRYRISLAEALAGNHQDERALSELTKVVDSGTDDGLARGIRAWLYCAAGKFKESIADCDVLSKTPRYTNFAYSTRASTYYVKGDYTNSLNDVKVFLQSEPNNVDGRYLRGTLYVELHQFDLAISDLEFAVSNKAELRKTYLVKAYDFLGAAYGNKKNYAASKTNYAIALQLDPNDHFANMGMGNCYFSQSDFTNALTYYSNGVISAPNSWNALHSRGYAYFRLGLLTNSITDFDKAISLWPADPFAHTYRGIAYLSFIQSDPKYLTNALYDCEIGLKTTNDPDTLKDAETLRDILIRAGVKPH